MPLWGTVGEDTNTCWVEGVILLTEGGVDTIKEGGWFKFSPVGWGLLTCHEGPLKGEDGMAGDGTVTGEGKVVGLCGWSWVTVIPLAEIIGEGCCKDKEEFGAGAIEGCIILLGGLIPAIAGWNGPCNLRGEPKCRTGATTPGLVTGLCLIAGCRKCVWNLGWMCCWFAWKIEHWRVVVKNDETLLEFVRCGK